MSHPGPGCVREPLAALDVLCLWDHYQPLDKHLSGLGQGCLASGEPSHPCPLRPLQVLQWLSAATTMLRLRLQAQLSFVSLSSAENSFPPSGSLGSRPAYPWWCCSASLSSSLLPKPPAFLRVHLCLAVSQPRTPGALGTRFPSRAIIQWALTSHFQEPPKERSHSAGCWGNDEGPSRPSLVSL